MESAIIVILFVVVAGLIGALFYFHKQAQDNLAALDRARMAAGRIKGISLRIKKENEYLKRTYGKVSEAEKAAAEIVRDAKRKSKNIFEEEARARANAERLKKTLIALRNDREGYGNEFLIPRNDLFDELSDEYGKDEVATDLKNTRKKIRKLIKSGGAAECEYLDDYRRSNAVRFVTDAFNSKVEGVLSKVGRDNAGVLQQQIKDAAAFVNEHGSAFREARVSDEFLDLRLKEVRFASLLKDIKEREREEQRAIKEQMREEEKAQREYDAEVKRIQKEEGLIKKALEEARAEADKARLEAEAVGEAKLAEADARLRELEEKLAEAEAKNERAMSMAQMTKSGHVYIISNIGSFGENVYKVGMTRRLEPMDRVKELGDASVPFGFDVHGMVHSENAPDLEKELHRRLSSKQVNKVNPRKEFFRTSIEEIKGIFEDLGYKGVHWTLSAQALEYRESLELGKRSVPAEPEPI